jgi:oligosaccharyltransferase complex subunit beta
VALVSAFQATNNARAVFAGSLDLFSDNFVEAAVQKYGESEKAYAKSGNEAFITELTKWAFQEKGVVKIVSVKHHKVSEKEQMSWYRINDNITYTLDLAEYKDDRWHPFDATDLQLEITMLDPYIRTYLNRSVISPTSPYARYVAKVQLPDVYGVFTFKINYKRPGLSYLESKHEVSIRPFRHNEYPRFLSAAYPYYAGSASMVVGFLVFSAVWLGTWGVRKADTKKK